MSMRFGLAMRHCHLGNAKAYYTLWPDVAKKTMWFSLFGRVFICLVVCLFVCLIFPFASFLISLFSDDR